MNLSEIVRALIQSGLSEGQIAAMLRDEHGVDVSQPTIHRIKQGKSENPHYKTGKALEKLYQERCEGQAA